MHKLDHRLEITRNKTLGLSQGQALKRLAPALSGASRTPAPWHAGIEDPPSSNGRTFAGCSSPPVRILPRHRGAPPRDGTAPCPGMKRSQFRSRKVPPGPRTLYLVPLFLVERLMMGVLQSGWALSSTSRTFLTKASRLNGFSRNAALWRSIPWRRTASLVWPDI